MPLTPLEIVDSAVKIGLGACITAIATYVTTKANHKNDRNKELRSHNLKTLELVAEKCERYMNSVYDFRDRLNGVLNERSTDDGYSLSSYELEALAEVDKNFSSALESVSTASARLGLMRANNARIELGKLQELILDLRNQVIVEGKAPSKADYEAFEKELLDRIERLHERLADIYHDIT